MVIDKNTTQMNTFSKGMNTDTSDAYLEEGAYRLANNLRYITNQEENSGELHMIEGATLLTSIPGTVLAATQLRDIGIIVTSGGGEKDWQVYTIENGSDEAVRIIDVDNAGKSRVVGHKISLVARWEDDDNAKLYIADGQGPIIIVFLKQNGVKDIDDIVAYPQVTFKVPKFCGLIDGSLKAGMYEYSYQYYNKHGQLTEISPSTKLIPLHNGALQVNDSNRILGYEQDAKTNKGISILVPTSDKFNKLIIYRICYVEVGVPPIIETVFDEDMPKGTDWFTFTDTGKNSLNIISLEEYNMMTGIHIIPKTIESMTDYMFASNIRNDNPVYYNDSVKNWDPKDNVSYDFLVADLIGDTCLSNDRISINTKEIGSFSNQILVDRYYSGGDYSGEKVSVDLSMFIGDPIDKNLTYTNPYVSYSLKSLRRGEKYRYGIVLYDKYHNATAVKHIGDIIVPSFSAIPTFSVEDDILHVYPIGIRFYVNLQDLPEDIKSYEIVRCGKDLSDMSTLTQCVISRPISKTFDTGKEYGEETDDNEGNSVTYDILSPASESVLFPTLKAVPSTTAVLTPTGFITNMDFWCGAFWFNSDISDGLIGSIYEDDYRARHSVSMYGATNSLISEDDLVDSREIKGNNRIFQIISPEYSYMSETVKDMFQKNQLVIDPISYIFPDYVVKNIKVSADIKENEDDWIRLNRTGMYYNIGNSYANVTVKQSEKPLGSGNTNAVSILNGIENWICYYNDGTKNDVHLGSESFKKNYSKNNSNRYEYIKLYNRVASNITNDINITSTGFPDQLGWDDFATAVELWLLKYVDHVTNIGNKPYCNWVAGGLYGVKKEEIIGATWFADESDDLQNAGSEVSGMMGPGGKCMLAAVDSDALCNDNNLIMGTYLCNIKQVSTPYNIDAKYSTYRSYGNYFNRTEDITHADVFDGDCFIQPFEYVSQHKWYHPYLENNRNALIVYSIPVETSINLAYTHGYELSKYIGSSEGDITNIQVNPSNVNNTFIQDKPLYSYNSVYSANSTSNTLAAEDSNNSDYFDSKFDYRVFNSVAKSNDEYVDNWLKFLPANFLDVDTRYGEITGLRKFNNSLVFWQENAAGLLSVNERVQITDDANMPLTLGTADVLSRYDYMNTSNGMRKDEYADTQSDTTLYWWDHNKHEILGYSGGTQVVSVSKAKFALNFLNEMDAKGKLIDDPLLWHDKLFNEVGFTVSDGDYPKAGSLIFGENIGAFSSLYSILPKAAITFKDSTLLLDKNGKVYKWNSLSNDGVKGIKDEALMPYLKYVVNANAVYTKVFDNAEIAGRLYGGGDTRTFLDNNPLNSLQFVFSTPLKQEGLINGSNIDNTEYNFRFAIPRNNNSPWGDRLRGKTMQAELMSTSNSYDFSLQCIMTKYRISWT